LKTILIFFCLQVCYSCRQNTRRKQNDSAIPSNRLGPLLGLPFIDRVKISRKRISASPSHSRRRSSSTESANHFQPGQFLPSQTWSVFTKSNVVSFYQVKPGQFLHNFYQVKPGWFLPCQYLLDQTWSVLTISNCQTMLVFTKLNLASVFPFKLGGLII
jgi:hypothetical protein